MAGHAGVAPKPLVRVASGGELARISLAIAVIAASATPVGTLIFGAGQGPAMMHRAAAADLYPVEQRAHGVGLVASAGAVGSIVGR